jgi:hypothetical protein
MNSHRIISAMAIFRGTFPVFSRQQYRKNWMPDHPPEADWRDILDSIWTHPMADLEKMDYAAQQGRIRTNRLFLFSVGKAAVI